MLGAAYAAGLAVGFWNGVDQVRDHWAEERRYEPTMSRAHADALYASWQKAVEKSLGWTEG